jgi:UDP-2,3-diacylglucosamine hydrolase
MTKPVSMITVQPETVALFISDLHLTQSRPKTTQAFLIFLQTHAMKARQLYLLGDMFEYWAGDDDITDPYNQKIVKAIRQVSDAGINVFWIAGNRDFLVGNDFACACGLKILSEPFVATIGEQRIILVHGDTQCTDDQAYMDFRSEVRAPEWQKEFLAMPLSRRKEIIEGLRSHSRKEQMSKSSELMDVNENVIGSLFKTLGTSIMIHGHTHRPARHEYQHGAHIWVRYVLPDWEVDTDPVRGGWIAVSNNGSIQHLRIDGTEIRQAPFQTYEQNVHPSNLA